MTAWRMTPTLGGAIAVLLVTAACGEPVDPATTGGQRLTGTGGVDYLGGQPFSLSPDGRWMLFSTRPATDSVRDSDDLRAILLQKLGTYVLYDLTRLEGTPVVVGQALRDSINENRGVLFDGGCWLPAQVGSVVGLRDTWGNVIATDPRATEPMWTTSEIDRDTYGEHCPSEDRLTGETVTVGPFRIEGTRTSEITIRDAHDAGLVYAVHRTRFPLRTLLVEEARLSPDGRRLAYSVSANFGSFIGHAKVLLISAHAPHDEPALLASAVYALRWSNDGSQLFADVPFEGQSAVYRWRVED